MRLVPYTTDCNEAGATNATVHSIILFEAFHRLLDSGYQAFATNDQLRGVVARYQGDTCLIAWALKCLTMESPGKFW